MFRIWEYIKTKCGYPSTIETPLFEKPSGYKNITASQTQSNTLNNKSIYNLFMFYIIGLFSS